MKTITTNQELFRYLLPGDVVRSRRTFEEASVVSTEKTYDFDTDPPTEYVWKVHLSDGTNLQDNDDTILEEVQFMVKVDCAKYRCGHLRQWTPELITLEEWIREGAYACEYCGDLMMKTE